MNCWRPYFNFCVQILLIIANYLAGNKPSLTHSFEINEWQFRNAYIINSTSFHFFSSRLTSPIDAKSFENLTNMKIRHSYDYTSNNLTAKIHWVEVYFLPQDNDTTVQRLSARELGQMTSSIAKACMSALSPHLMTLIALEMTRIGLRVNLAANFVS